MGFGRPKAGEERPTTSVRMSKDLATMIGWISSVTGKPVSRILDEYLRPVVIARYALHLDAIKNLKIAMDTARAASGEPPTEPLPDIGPVIDVPPLPQSPPTTEAKEEKRFYHGRKNPPRRNRAGRSKRLES